MSPWKSIIHENCDIPGAHDKDCKIDFVNMIVTLKEEMNQSLKEISQNKQWVEGNE